jgi:hypothetical protein
VDGKIKAAIEQYEQKIIAGTTPRQPKQTNPAERERTENFSKVENEIMAINYKITNIAELEPLTIKPTKLVQAVIDLQVDMATIRNAP